MIPSAIGRVLSYAAKRHRPTPADHARLDTARTKKRTDQETDMWPLNIIFPSGRTLQVMPRHLWLGAALLAAIVILVAYVALLNQSVERGAAQARALLEAAGAPAVVPVKGGAFGSTPRKRSSVAG
jgi:hypothetical protein